MPKLLTWRPEWSLHLDTLDRDHRALIEQLADVCLRFCPEASSGRAGNALALIDALTDLGEAMRAHFRREEEFMRSFAYDGIGRHRNEHAILMAEYTDMLREWRAEGLHVFDEAAQSTVRDWLLAHILGADREFANAYFRLCGRDESPDQKRVLVQLQSSYRSSLSKSS